MKIMIIGQSPPKVASGNYDYIGLNTSMQEECDYNRFGEEMPDGRLTGEGGKLYRLRDAIREKERLGRPLTEDEMKQFELKE